MLALYTLWVGADTVPSKPVEDSDNNDDCNDDYK